MSGTGVDLCEHGDYRAACLECLNGPPDPSARARRTPPRLDSGHATATAAFESTCPRCRGSIDVGDPIAFTEDGWVHDDAECNAPRDGWESLF